MKNTTTRIGMLVLVLAFILIVSAMPVLAATQINIKTLAGHKVSTYVLKDSEDYQLLASYHKQADAFGKLSIEYPGTQATIKIKVKVMSGTTTVILQDFTGITTGSPLYLRVVPGDISENYLLDEGISAPAADGTNASANASADSEANSADTNAAEEESENSALTGLSVMIDKIASIKDKIKLSYVLYALIGAVLIGGVVMLVIKKPFAKRKLLIFGSSGKSQKEIEDLDVGGIDEKRLLDAERKIKEAEEELEAIKNKKNELSEAEKQFKEAKARLEHLKGHKIEE